MGELRTNTKKLIYALCGFIIVLIGVSLVLHIVKASSDNMLFSLVASVSDFFVFPFLGLVGDVTLISVRLPADYIVAIFSYVFLAIFLGELFTAFMYETLRDVVQNFLDAMFKFLELLLFVRILVDLFDQTISKDSSMVLNSVYALTEWSTGIIPGLSLLGLYLNLSTMLCLVIIALIDSQFERLLDAIFDFIGFGRSKVNLIKPVTKVVYVVSPARLNELLGRLFRRRNVEVVRVTNSQGKGSEPQVQVIKQKMI